MGEWIEAYDEDGLVYYHNTTTGQFQWTVPGRPEWEVQRTADGLHYYYFNSLTGRCLWQLQEWEERVHEGAQYFCNVLTGESVREWVSE